ncbi:MAG: IS1595 family transposase [Geminicoccaceae bacterium]|nr:IS1595 family transposase [Geminicoccaceae bacterium]
MQHRAFERWCGGIQALNAVQVGKLRALLEALDDRLRTLAMIEARSGDSPGCRHCGCERLRRWGRTGCGVQRWHCSDCRRTMSSTTAMPLAQMRKRDRFMLVLEDMLGPHPSSCRQLAERLGVDKMTVWRWRHRIMDLMGVDPANAGHEHGPLAGIVEADETFCRESRKGSRQWVRHERDPAAHSKPDRLRWKDYKRLKLKLPTGVSRYQMPILTVTDRAGRIGAERVAGRRGGDLLEALNHQLTANVVLCSDGDPVYRQFANRHHLPHHVLRDKPGHRIIQNVFHIQTVNSLHQRFHAFIGLFRGPATRYLDRYIHWFLARARKNDNPSDRVWTRLSQLKTTG